MNELMGLLDSLEATILEGKRIPLTDKIMLEEKKILSLVDKLRLVLKSNGSIVKRSVDQSRKEEAQKTKSDSAIPGRVPEQMEDLLAQAHVEAEKIKDGAKEYADYILANLQLLVTKMQKNLIKVEKGIEDGRHLIEKSKQKEDPFYEPLG